MYKRQQGGTIKHEKKVILRVLIVLLVGLVLGLGIYVLNGHKSVSFLDSQLMKFLDGDCDEEAFVNAFPEDSAERLLAKGIVSFETGKMTFDTAKMGEAEEYFNAAKEKPYRDSTTSVYLGIYQNDCAFT